jgi:hypothetical protein
MLPAVLWSGLANKSRIALDVLARRRAAVSTVGSGTKAEHLVPPSRQLTASAKDHSPPGPALQSHAESRPLRIRLSLGRRSAAVGVNCYRGSSGVRMSILPTRIFRWRGLGRNRGGRVFDKSLGSVGMRPLQTFPTASRTPMWAPRHVNAAVPWLRPSSLWLYSHFTLLILSRLPYRGSNHRAQSESAIACFAIKATRPPLPFEIVGRFSLRDAQFGGDVSQDPADETIVVSDIPGLQAASTRKPTVARIQTTTTCAPV